MSPDRHCGVCRGAGTITVDGDRRQLDGHALVIWARLVPVTVALVMVDAVGSAATLPCPSCVATGTPEQIRATYERRVVLRPGVEAPVVVAPPPPKPPRPPRAAKPERLRL